MGWNRVEIDGTLLYNMGFSPTHYDPNIWIKLREDMSGCDNISMNVDDFMITAKSAWPYMKEL